jgi:hypothetical protein
MQKPADKNLNQESMNQTKIILTKILSRFQQSLVGET